MKKFSLVITMIAILFMAFAACQPSQVAIEKAIQQTQTSDAAIQQAIQKTQVAKVPTPTLRLPTPTLRLPTASTNTTCEIREREKSNWKVFVCDQFNNDANNVWLGSSDDNLVTLKAKISSGKYILDMTYKPYGKFTGAAYQWFTLGEYEGDYLLQLDGEISSKNKTVFWGLAVRGTSMNDYYTFVIDNSGGYSIQRLDDKFTPIVSYGTNGAIKWSEVNTVKAIAEGNNISFYVNETLIKTIKSSSNSAPMMFLVVAGAEGIITEYKFDNLLIKYD